MFGRFAVMVALLLLGDGAMTSTPQPPAREAAAAIDEAVPAPVLTTALYERFSSRGEADFQNKLLSAMRYEFGGHLEKPTNERPR